MFFQHTTSLPDTIFSPLPLPAPFHPSLILPSFPSIHLSPPCAQANCTGVQTLWRRDTDTDMRYIPTYTSVYGGGEEEESFSGAAVTPSPSCVCCVGQWEDWCSNEVRTYIRMYMCAFMCVRACCEGACVSVWVCRGLPCGRVTLCKHSTLVRCAN